jgi:hypothetical protein
VFQPFFATAMMLQQLCFPRTETAGEAHYNRETLPKYPGKTAGTL